MTAASTAGEAAGQPTSDTGVHAAQHTSKGQLGRVVERTRLPRDRWLPHAADAYRVLYTSTSHDGSKTVVSGVVYLPEKRPAKGGWPVISWAHGTTGSADRCAPSLQGVVQFEQGLLGTWLENGYAVVATDYEGLGTPGPHPYTHGKSQAYGVIDMVRAARSQDKRLSSSWMSAGWSQGGQAALFTGSLVDDYAPELDYRGTMAAAPLTLIRMNAVGLGFLDKTAPVIPFIPAVTAATELVYGDEFMLTDLLTDRGAPVYLNVLEKSCINDTRAELEGLAMQDFFDMSDEKKLTGFLDMWGVYGDVPLTEYDEPVLIVQGGKDTAVYPPSTLAATEGLREAGTEVTLKYYEVQDHRDAVVENVADFMVFTNEQFDR